MANRLTLIYFLLVALLSNTVSYAAKVDDAFSVSKLEANHAFSASFSYDGDVAANIQGGVKQGTKYVGYASLSLNLDIEKAGGWKGGELLVSGANTQGGGFSEKLVGDRFYADDNDVGNYTFLTEVWYKQNFNDRVDFTVGLQDINSNFAVNDESSMFVNAAFGMNAVFSQNIMPPSFPLNGLGFELGWNINDRWRWQACAYDGLVEGFEDNPANIRWKIKPNEGFVLATEWQYSHEEHGTYKLGANYHTATNLYGVYASLESHPSARTTIFSQLAYAPKKGNDVYATASLGFNFHKLFSKRHVDVLGIACVSNLFTNDEKHETICELTYKYRIVKFLYIQPSIQYIINPSLYEGTGNALLAILRLSVRL